MSIIYEYENCVLISHPDYIKKVYKDINYKLSPSLFALNKPFKKQPNKSKILSNNETLKNDCTYIKLSYEKFLPQLKKNAIIKPVVTKIAQDSQDLYLKTADVITDCIGGNTKNESLIVELNTNYLIPSDCKFYAKNVKDIPVVLNNEKFDLIVLDPPWWNKAIRRKRLKLNNGYDMLNNEDIKNIPIADLLSDNAIVVVWCTNSAEHISKLREEMFKEWKVEVIAEWFWLKITNQAEPIINFSEPPLKQPFERILIATNNKNNTRLIPDKKIIVSVPSLIHSHKPPLIELLDFTKKDTRCLEIFARYLLPGWSSYGLEVLRLQNKLLYN